MAEPTFAEALDAMTRAMATNVRDWGADRMDAFLWGVLLGWDCDDQHEHDEHCSGAMQGIAARHGWDAKQVQRVRAFHQAVTDTAHLTTTGLPYAARAGWESAIAELRGVAARTGSPAAQWAVEYLTVDPDKMAPGGAIPAGSCVCTGSGWPHVPSSARCTPPVGTQPLPLSIGRVQAYCGAVERPHAGHVWTTQPGRWCPGDEVPGRPEPRAVDAAPKPQDDHNCGPGCPSPCPLDDDDPRGWQG